MMPLLFLKEKQGFVEYNQRMTTGPQQLMWEECYNTSLNMLAI